MQTTSKPKPKVFLGGTCNDSDWRDKLIPMLKINYYNPVVPDWTPECQQEEIRQRETCDFCLYTITPRMTGVYSIAEVVDDSNKRPGRTVFCILSKDGDQWFTSSQLRSLMAVAAMVERNGGKIATNLGDVATYLNGGNHV
jgi:hypothetical protein